ncbi:hypothetical protein B0T11DRAFT_328251 [Plectosphaerella cucumerina]|uniref:Uncharacterized protein n=1 Tax=Plectosphaerella cucumerina TaxID=40658 RepID=A0A8K0X2Y4_9PEZI|nr:hypothetical protein B0T11DRAFT_328251 [Plectosphaerella cucumerina]
MVKRSLDTERSHEENQERAYIAASRRADRSIEARVKSAQMASEIHKKRTGKGFKISERIVQAEEMYEEEDDDMPRSYRALAAHLQTGSPELNYRVNAFLANRVAMASMVAGMRNDDWLQNPINKMFAEQFPHADKQAQAMSHRLSNSSYYAPVAGQAQGQGQEATRGGSISAASPMSPSFGSVDYHPHGQFPTSRSQSIAKSPTDDRSSAMSPPPLSPGVSDKGPVLSAYRQPFSPETSVYSNSAFTAELPMEAKMMAGLDMTDPMSSMMMGGHDSFSQFYPEDPSPALKQEPHFDSGYPLSPAYFDATHQQMMGDFSSYDDQQSNIQTPIPTSSNEWDNFMDWSGCGGDAASEPFRG